MREGGLCVRFAIICILLLWNVVEYPDVSVMMVGSAAISVFGIIYVRYIDLKEEYMIYKREVDEQNTKMAIRNRSK